MEKKGLKIKLKTGLNQFRVLCESPVKSKTSITCAYHIGTTGSISRNWRSSDGNLKATFGGNLFRVLFLQERPGVCVWGGGGGGRSGGGGGA